jgi:hypothetical protein
MRAGAAPDRTHPHTVMRQCGISPVPEKVRRHLSPLAKFKAMSQYLYLRSGVELRIRQAKKSFIGAFVRIC